MKLSDYVVNFLVESGIRHVFLVSGGAVIHLVDSVARNPKMTYICSQHEQQAGASADGYARVNGLGAVMVTSGPGATNLLTSVCNCYYDSIPCLFLCGQVATFRLKKSKRLRQMGFQETDVISIFKPITKYVCQIQDPQRIRYELQKAVYLATSNRQGPVILDIPDDIQRADINPNNLPAYTLKSSRRQPTTSGIKKIFILLSKAKRPVLILGAGIGRANVQNEVKQFAHFFNLPTLFTWGGMDVLPASDHLNMGSLGVCGPRAGNFTVQNADVVIAVGTRLSQLITGGKQNLFAPHAKKVMVDIDRDELDKFNSKTFTLDVKVNMNLTDFFAGWGKYYALRFPDRFKQWRDQISSWHKKYPICPKDYYQSDSLVNPYVFIKTLSRVLKEDSIIYADTGANLAWTAQAFEVKKGQKIFSAWNHTPMGYALPASIGGAFATNKSIICLIGDGGLMMCLSELATVSRYNLPIKIFIFNNHGHGIQKQTLDVWLNSHYVAVDENTGLSFPDFIKIGKAFKLSTHTIDCHTDLKKKISAVLESKEAVLCNVEIHPDQRIIPMLKFGAGLEDLAPYLQKEELEEVMSVSKS